MARNERTDRAARSAVDAMRHRRELDGAEVEGHTRSGKQLIHSISAIPVVDADGDFSGYRGSGRDVTQARRLASQLVYQASHDELTGLVNRRELEDRLTRAVDGTRTTDAMHALCFLDLDQFKVVNDTCGHSAGDELLRQLAQSLQSGLRGRDTLGRFIQPRIEAEIAFVMKSAIGGADVTRDEVLAATDYVAPSLEILDTRIVRVDAETGRTRTVFDTISDNAANAGVVLGAERHAVDAFDLRWVGAITSRDGAVEETGLGAGVLNDPVESVVWLARRMAQYGQSIAPGQIILSGSFIRPVECPPGVQIHADFGTFGTVDIAFA